MTRRLGLIGCGGMGLRHAYGYIELRTKYDTFELVAVCDRHEVSAEHIASVVEKANGSRPAVYLDYREMLDAESLDAIDITTDTRMHHTLAVAAFERGVNVLTEKPMGLTIKACRAMQAAATKAGRDLSVGEQYRRDPMNRLTKALIDSGAIGQPAFAVKFMIGGGSALMHGTGWRALKSRAGSIILEQGVHESDLLQYFMGDVEGVFAQTGIVARQRVMAGINPNLAPFYQHRVEDEFVGQETVEIDQEDTAFGVLRFAAGTIGQFTITNASHGYSAGVNTVHGSAGTVILPPARSGIGPRVMIEGKSDPLSEEDMLSLVPEWELDDVTAAFWDGTKRMASYDVPFEASDRKLVAIELQELADAIDGKTVPEVGAEVGMKGLALPYAMLESGLSGEVVRMKDVLEGSVSKYQDEINQDIGL